MTNEEAKAFLDNLKICIDEHPVVADWLVEIANRKTENSSEKPNNCANCKHLKKHNGDLADWVCDRKGSIVTNPYDKECDEMWERKDEPQTDCGDFADRLAYERGVKHAWGVAQKAFDSTLTFYEAEDLAKQIDKDINVRSKDEPQNYCDDCLYTDTCDSKEFFYACTSKATISKMEQVDKDMNVRSKDEPRKEQNFCGKCRYLYRDFKYGLSCYRLMDNEPCKYEERKDEPTISKMEQVDEPIDRDDLGNCNICKYVGLEHRCNQCVNGSMFCKVEDEPQTEREGE